MKSAPCGSCIRLEYRPPFRFGELLAFFGARVLAGVEAVNDVSYSRTACIALPGGGEAQGWIRVEDDAKRNALLLSMSESLVPAASQVAARVRRMFDLDCDPYTVHDGLKALDAARPGARVLGTRVPGCFDPFETCCRAVLGQQISVSAANKLAERVVKTYGSPLDMGIDGLEYRFPSPAQIQAFDDIAGAFGPLGVIRTRCAVIGELACMVSSGALDFDTRAHVPEQMAALLKIKGVGPWTANYIAMRAFSYPDAFLESDAGVAHALFDMTPKERTLAVEPCRPWRSYAVVSLWNSLAH